MSECDWHWEMQNGIMRKVWHNNKLKPKATMPKGQTDLEAFK